MRVFFSGLFIFFLSNSAFASGIKLLRFDLCEILTLNCPIRTVEVTDQLDRCGCLYPAEMVELANCPTKPAACESGTKWSWLTAKKNQKLIGCGCYDTYYPDEN